MGWWPFSPLCLSYQYLWWRKPPVVRPADPPRRDARLTYHEIYGADPGRWLEICHAAPPTRTSRRPAIVFVHGGMGSAWVWEETMLYLSLQNIPCYAVSLRGHGRSWCPGYFSMLFTGIHDVARDLVAALAWVSGRETAGYVLAGHSAGGGLAQYVLANMGEEVVPGVVKGLVLLAPYPGTGSFKIFANWARFDNLFGLRMLLHMGHPNSPLSHPTLTHNAFFSSVMPREQVEEFHSHICPYESLRWPMGMVRHFADLAAVVRQAKPGPQTRSAGKILIIAGRRDKLMTLDIMYDLAARFRGAAKHDEGTKAPERIDRDVEFVVVDGAHHMQNDVNREDTMAVLADWYSKMNFGASG